MSAPPGINPMSRPRRWRPAKPMWWTSSRRSPRRKPPWMRWSRFATTSSNPTRKSCAWRSDRRSERGGAGRSGPIGSPIRNDERTRNSRRRARHHLHPGAGGEPADAGRPCGRRGDFAHTGAHPDPGIDARLRPQDHRHLPGDAPRAAVHGRTTRRPHEPHHGPYHRGLTARERAMSIDISFLPALAAAFLLVFARIGMMLMLLPGIGEQTIPTRMRLTVALAMTIIMLPLHRAAYQIDLTALAPAITLLAEELLVFATDTHYLAIAALDESYSLFAPGTMPFSGDMAAHITAVVAAAFRIGVQ